MEIAPASGLYLPRAEIVPARNAEIQTDAAANQQGPLQSDRTPRQANRVEAATSSGQSCQREVDVSRTREQPQTAATVARHRKPRTDHSSQAGQAQSGGPPARKPVTPDAQLYPIWSAPKCVMPAAVEREREAQEYKIRLHLDEVEGFFDTGLCLERRVLPEGYVRRNMSEQYLSLYNERAPEEFPRLKLTTLPPWPNARRESEWNVQFKDCRWPYILKRA